MITRSSKLCPGQAVFRTNQAQRQAGQQETDIPRNVMSRSGPGTNARPGRLVESAAGGTGARPADLIASPVWHPPFARKGA